MLRLPPNFPIVITSICLLLLGVMIDRPVMAEELNAKNFERLDKEFQELSSHFFQTYSPHSQAIFDNMVLLEQAVKSYQKNNLNIEAIALIRANLALIKRNIDSPSVLGVLTFLLERNEWESADQLFNTIQQDGNKIIISNAHFAMAKYYMKRHKWQSSLDYLDGITGDLAPSDADYANLMQGVALQRLKKHRDAIRFYEKDSPISQYYFFITLNLAVSYIRQDWWTDAHLAINKLLDQPQKNTSNELLNRLNVVLGYSLMRQGYYRNSREAFRNVDLHSQYINQALLGVALSAISQMDYVGALNAVNILKARQGNDLPSEEAYLLLPSIYSSLEQHLTASAGYSSAIEHYMHQIQVIEHIMASNNDLHSDIKISDNKSVLSVKEYEFNFSEQYPHSLLENYQMIISLKDKTQNKETIKLVTKLYSNYNSTLTQIARKFLNERVAHLNNYIDQSKYGIALLYDNSQTE